MSSHGSRICPRAGCTSCFPGPGKPCAKPRRSKWPPDMADISTVYTLRQAALILGETEDMVLEASIGMRSEEHTSELQSLMRISYAVFCLKKKTTLTRYIYTNQLGIGSTHEKQRDNR